MSTIAPAQVPAPASSRLSYKQRRAAGKAMRDQASRASHASIGERSPEFDPVELVLATTDGCLEDLLPIRFGRMAASPFAFFRGSAALMAKDLASTPVTRIAPQVCGDAHLMNFGGFASPERRLVFDINDFDETHVGPWEWDVKRLAASVQLAARDRGFRKDQADEAVAACVRSYRVRMAEYAPQLTLDIWYARIDAIELADEMKRRGLRRDYERVLDRAKDRTAESVVPKLTRVVDGTRRFVDEPPLIFHVDREVRITRDPHVLIQSYRASLTDDHRHLFDRYELVDVAMKVVGVGSVGTRCAVALLLADDRDPLILQIKEARASVLEAHLGESPFQNQGRRVVAGQRLMQAASDIFLGWARDGAGHDFYLRQLRDMKVSVQLENMSAEALQAYAELCGWALAMSHARCGVAASISGYLGSGPRFDDAIVSFARDYADRAEGDHATFVAAIAAGRIPADKG